MLDEDKEQSGFKIGLQGCFLIQRDPVVVFWPSCFLEAWGTKAKKPHMVKNITVFLAVPPKAARPNTSFFLEHVWLLALVPKAFKKTLGQKTTSGSL